MNAHWAMQGCWYPFGHVLVRVWMWRQTQWVIYVTGHVRKCTKQCLLRCYSVPGSVLRALWDYLFELAQQPTFSIPNGVNRAIQNQNQDWDSGDWTVREGQLPRGFCLLLCSYIPQCFHLCIYLYVFGLGVNKGDHAPFWMKWCTVYVNAINQANSCSC